jgi:cytidylate kinase
MHGPRRIAIDGPAGSGKSTVGEKLARQLSYLYIDTGAMYRAVAWLALDRGIGINSEVRSVLIAQQRKLGEREHIVMVGRDIGAVVLPEAELKIYLTANLRERARRRLAELAERGGKDDSAVPSLEAMMDDIQLRDDTDRENMLPAKDAVFIETDHLSVSQVLAKISQYVEELCETGYEC